jgi:hypothetical protein
MAIPKEQRRSRVIRQIRTLGLGVLAVLAVGVAMSASASAHEFFVCREGGTTKYENDLCAKKTETGKFSFLPVEGAEKYTVEGTSGTAKLETKHIYGIGIGEVIECNKDVFAGEITAEGVGKGESRFSECKWYEVSKERGKKLISGCTVPNLTFDVTDKLITGQDSGVEDEFTPQSGEAFVKYEIDGCALEGSYELKESETEILPAKQKLKGMDCALPEAAAGKVEHEIVCTSSGDHLSFQANPASFYSTEAVKLASGVPWAAE